MPEQSRHFEVEQKTREPVRGKSRWQQRKQAAQKMIDENDWDDAEVGKMTKEERKELVDLGQLFKNNYNHQVMWGISEEAEGSTAGTRSQGATIGRSSSSGAEPSSPERPIRLYVHSPLSPRETRLHPPVEVDYDDSVSYERSDEESEEVDASSRLRAPEPPRMSRPPPREVDLSDLDDDDTSGEHSDYSDSPGLTQEGKSYADRKIPFQGPVVHAPPHQGRRHIRYY